MITNLEQATQITSFFRDIENIWLVMNIYLFLIIIFLILFLIELTVNIIQKKKKDMSLLYIFLFIIIIYYMHYFAIILYIKPQICSIYNIHWYTKYNKIDKKDFCVVWNRKLKVSSKIKLDQIKEEAMDFEIKNIRLEKIKRKHNFSIPIIEE